jgi:hypothetical protein
MVGFGIRPLAVSVAEPPHREASASDCVAGVEIYKWPKNFCKMEHHQHQ